MRALIAVLTGIGLAAMSAASLAKIYYSKQEAMELAFGKDAEVEMLPLFLTSEQRRRIEQKARTKLESSLYTLYVGKRDGSPVGYAAIETHTVRTKPETLLIVLNPDGTLKRIEILAFHEPQEYQPPDRWFAQLLGGVSLEDLRLGGEVEGISGATLSARAAIESVRKIVSLYREMVVGEKR